MKASDRGRNVKFLGNNFGCVLSKLTNNKDISYQVTAQLFVSTVDALMFSLCPDACPVVLWTHMQQWRHHITMNDLKLSSYLNILLICEIWVLFYFNLLLLVCMPWPIIGQPQKVSSSAECSREYNIKYKTKRCITQQTDVIKPVDELVSVGSEALVLFQSRCSISSTVDCFTALVNNLQHLNI